LHFVAAGRVDYRLRPSRSAIFGQAVAYGASRPVLAERWRERGGTPPISRWRGARNWVWLLRHVAMLWNRDERARWYSVAGNRLGNLRGSVRVRRLYL
jgi:hypothetical protein